MERMGKGIVLAFLLILSIATGCGAVLIPTQVGTKTNCLSISGGEFHTCASTKDDGLYCWGFDYGGYGGFGDIMRLVPQFIEKP